MTKECLEILRRGGRCSIDDYFLLINELPRSVFEIVIHRKYYYEVFTYIKFYLHDVRGYCVISEDLSLDESEMKFYNLEMDKVFANYSDLEEYFISSGGYSAADPRCNSSVADILTKKKITGTRDYDVLFQHMNYIVEIHGEHRCVAVIWLNSHEYCTMEAVYTLNDRGELGAVPLLCGGIKYYDHGVALYTIPDETDSMSFEEITDDEDSFEW